MLHYHYPYLIGITFGI